MRGTNFGISPYLGNHSGYALACKARILRRVTVIGNVATRLAWLLT